jgi:hypothetical protein
MPGSQARINGKGLAKVSKITGMIVMQVARNAQIFVRIAQDICQFTQQSQSRISTIT